MKVTNKFHFYNFYYKNSFNYNKFNFSKPKKLLYFKIISFITLLISVSFIIWFFLINFLRKIYYKQFGSIISFLNLFSIKNESYYYSKSLKQSKLRACKGIRALAKVLVRYAIGFPCILFLCFEQFILFCWYASLIAFK